MCECCRCCVCYERVNAADDDAANRHCFKYRLHTIHRCRSALDWCTIYLFSSFVYLPPSPFPASTSQDTTTHEVLTGSVDGRVRRYDIRAGRLATDYLGEPVTSVCFSHDRNCILASTLDSTIRWGDLCGSHRVTGWSLSGREHAHAATTDAAAATATVHAIATNIRDSLPFGCT